MSDVQSPPRSREVVYYLGETRVSEAVFMAEVRRREAERKQAPWTVVCWSLPMATDKSPETVRRPTLRSAGHG